MKKDESFEVYIIAATNGKLYTGITNDLNRRFSEHATHQKGARFFHFAAPDKLMFHEKCKNRSEALKRECEIKKLKKNQKLELIQHYESTKSLFN